MALPFAVSIVALAVVCFGCGGSTTDGGGSGGAGGSGGGSGGSGGGSGGSGGSGGGMCGNGAPFPSVDPTCMLPSDCTFYVAHGCCGDEVVGIAKAGADATKQAISAWESTCPACPPVGCAAATRADDGSTGAGDPTLLCKSGVCSTTFKTN